MYFKGPCRTGMLDGQDVTGVVFGNGPSIDKLRGDFFRKCDKDKIVSVGTNRFALSTRARRSWFFPTIYFTWDCPNRKNERLAEDMHQCMTRVGGISWRVAVMRPNDHDLFVADQYLRVSDSWVGDIERDGVRSQATVVDGAVNLLYRMGIRKVFLYGVDHKPGYLEMVGHNPAEVVWQLGGDACVHLANEWKAIRAGMPGLDVRCANKDSLLVDVGAVAYGELP